FQAEDGIRDFHVTGVQTCALPICSRKPKRGSIASSVGTTRSTATALSTGSLPWLVTPAKIANCYDAAKRPTVELDGVTPTGGLRSEGRRVGKEVGRGRLGRAAKMR